MSKRARFLSRLRRRGLPAAALARMTCPIGMPGIRSKRPELIAVAVVAQMLVIALQRGEPEEQDVRTPGQGGRRPMTRT